MQPFYKLHPDLKRQALKYGSLIIYEDPDGMELSLPAWKLLTNVELLSECKKTPIMEAYYEEGPKRKLRWRRQYL
jgi:hypothetical protein